MRRFLRRSLVFGAIAGVAYGVWRALSARRSESAPEWETQPFPYPPTPKLPDDEGADVEGATPPWVEPRDGTCPATHPVKAKLRSGIYHLPDGALYDRTNPDRCYVDVAAAEADDLRPSQR